MKRTGNLFERIVAWDNLRLAVAKALRSKRDRADAREFCAGLDWRLPLMAEQLRQGTFPVGHFDQFVIYDPKERLITKPCFAERVMHHAVMNVCEPVFERWLIRDTYACRAGLGRDAAIARARQFAGRHAFFLKLDIRKYFDSISHSTLLSFLERLFKDDRLLDLFARIIGSYVGWVSRPVLDGSGDPSYGNRGLPIGSLTSQHFANFYLGWFDRYVKEWLHVPGYVRYMDDMLLWGESSGALRGVLDRCQEFVGLALDLTFKPHPYINRTALGVDFLGCRVWPTHVTLNRRSRVRFRRKMLQLETDYLEGRIDEQELQERATSLVAFTRAAGARSWQFRRAVLEQLPVSGRRPGSG